MANELDPLSNVVAIIDYCRTAGTSPDLDVLAELLAKVPTSHPNPDKCCPDCVREKQMAVAAMNKALDAALVKAILPNTGDGSRGYPYLKGVDGVDRKGKWCHCGQCNTVMVCSPSFDFYTGPRFPDGTLFCEMCMTKAPVAGTKAEPHRTHLFCAHCGMRHTDRGEWAARPHHNHKCEHCLREFDSGAYAYGLEGSGGVCFNRMGGGTECLCIAAPIANDGKSIAAMNEAIDAAKPKAGGAACSAVCVCYLDCGADPYSGSLHQHDGEACPEHPNAPMAGQPAPHKIAVMGDGQQVWPLENVAQPAPTAERRWHKNGFECCVVGCRESHANISPEKWDAGDRAVMTQLRGAPTAEGGKLAGLVATLAEMEHGEDCEFAEEHCECGLDTARYFAQQAAAEHAAEVERLKIRIGNEVTRAVKAETTLVPREDGNRYLTEAIAVFEDVGNAGMLSPKLALSKLLGTIDLLRSAKDSHNNPWITVEDIASGSSFSCTQSNVKDPLVISLRSDMMRVRADLAELRQIDAALARRPALDKPTRYENIVHAITTAGDATDKANRYLSDIKAILSLLGVDVAEVNWTEPSVYATAQKAWHKVTNATVLARGERDAAQAKLLAVRQAWKDLRANMSVYETSGRHHMRGVWFKGGDAVTQVLAVEQALV